MLIFSKSNLYYVTIYLDSFILHQSGQRCHTCCQCNGNDEHCIYSIVTYILYTFYIFVMFSMDFILSYRKNCFLRQYDVRVEDLSFVGWLNLQAQLLSDSNITR